MICQDFVMNCHEILLVYLDEILTRFFQDLPRNVDISSSWQYVSSFERDVNIMHVLSRLSSFDLLGKINDLKTYSWRQ